MALTPGHDHPNVLPALRLAARPTPERPPAEEGDLVDAMDRIAAHLATVVVLSKSAAVLLSLLVVGLALRLLGVG